MEVAVQDESRSLEVQEQPSDMDLLRVKMMRSIEALQLFEDFRGKF